MRYRSLTLVALVALIVAIGIGGCTRPVRPPLVPTEAFPASPSATPVPPTAPPLADAVPPADSVLAVSGPTTPVPILYKMFDYGTDFQSESPELGPIGSIQWYDWERINPERGAYNWAPIDSKLELEAKLKVTLPDGTEIPKPVVIQIMATTSGSTAKRSYTDHTPTWVYDIIDSQNPDNPRPIVEGRKVGHRLVGCETQAVLPMYDSPTWREYHYEMVRAFGERYNNHPQVTAIVVNTGLDGETQPMKDLHCPWNTHLDQQAGDVRYNFGKFMQEVMAVYREAFPDKTIYVNNAPGGSGTRKMISDLAASFDPPIGLKHSGMWVDLDSHQGHGEFYGSWDMIRTYSMTLPIWLESPFGLGGPEHRYWSLIAGLHYHPDAIDCHPEYFSQSDPEWLRFAVSHLGVTIEDTPDVWTVLRDTEFPLVSWGKAGVSGHMGDWTFWLNRSDSAPQSDTQVVLREQMPVAQDHVFSRQARRTIQDENHIFMSFDVDDDYPYVDQKPIDLDGGTVYYRVHVTLLNQGEDTFSLQYRNWEGGIVRQMLQKGPHLGPVDDWVTVSFLVRDGYWNNNMPGDVDFRISCERDGDEYIHMIRVEGGWGVPPPPTETPLPTKAGPPTPTGAATATPPGGGDPAATSAAPTPASSLGSTPTPMPNAIAFAPSADTYIDEWEPSQTHHRDPLLLVRLGDIRAPLLRFDLEGIPPETTVDKAILSFAVGERTNAGILKVAAHRVARPWDETVCTWQYARPRESWGSPGCKDTATDLSANRSAEVWLDGPRRWYDLDITSLVQEWVRIPNANHGMVLKTGGSTYVQYQIHASEALNPDAHPRLQVVLQNEPGAPVTAPTFPLMPTGTPVNLVPPAPPSTDEPRATESPVSPLPDAGVHLFQQGREGYEGCQDTFVDAWAPSDNYASSDKLFVGQGALQSALLRFDLTPIDASSRVMSARLSLYAADRSASHGLDLNLHGIQRPWDIEHVTYERASNTRPWHEAGLGSPLHDLLGAEPAARGQATAAGEWIVFEIGDLVQDWISFPERNHGMVIKGGGSDAVQYELMSSDEPSNPKLRPKLQVAWESAPATPTVVGPPPASTFTPIAAATPKATATGGSAKIVLQQGLADYDGAQDTFLDGWGQDTPMGERSTIDIQQPGIRVGLISYDLSALPRDATVTQARLLLWSTASSDAGEMQMSSYRLMRPWHEAQATWLQADASTTWAAPGASQAGHDESADRLDQATSQIAFSGEGQWAMLDVTQDVALWHEQPEENLGWLLKGEGDTSVEHQFASSQWRDAGQRPKLIITYELPARGGPNPAKKLSLLQWVGIILGPMALLYLLITGGRAAMARRQRQRVVR